MDARRVSCPTCHRDLEWSEQFPWRPFCSERCKMIDLGAWFAEERGIAGDPAGTTEDSGLPTQSGQ